MIEKLNLMYVAICRGDGSLPYVCAAAVGSLAPFGCSSRVPLFLYWHLLHFIPQNASAT